MILGFQRIKLRFSFSSGIISRIVAMHHPTTNEMTTNLLVTPLRAFQVDLAADGCCRPVRGISSY